MGSHHIATFMFGWQAHYEFTKQWQTRHLLAFDAVKEDTAAAC
jgi:hypothetical protein